MLNKTITYDDGNQRSWKLTFPIDNDWANQKRRVLVILQSVDGRDIKAGKILGDQGVRTAFVESYKYARRIANQHLGDKDLRENGLCVVNHQSFRHLHLKGTPKAEAESEFRARTLAIIKKLNPTHILFSGNLNVLYPMPFAQLKNGWVHKIDGRTVTSTVDFSHLLEKQGQYANLLGFWCRHFAALLTGETPHSLATLEPKPRYVNTMARFREMMAGFDRASEVALDTEAKSLAVNKNPVYTMQMAFDHTPDVGYVLPIDHPHEKNPFTPEERLIIKRELRRRFGNPKAKQLLITFNGIFDLRLIRKNLRLPIIYMPVWECMAGEHLLDENASSLTGIGVKEGGISPNGLAGVLLQYGNDFYIRGDLTFSKKDRETVGSVDPGDKGFLKYASMDVVGLIGIKASQLARSRFQHIMGKSYTPFFKAHMMHQMSDTVHQLSHLKEAGSLVNKRYLRSLMQPDSVLAKAIKELNTEFKAFPEVQEANKQLLAESGFKAKDLFSTFGAGAAANAKKGSKQWMFSFNKAAHKIKLFLTIMGLEAVDTTDTGAPSINKAFIETYKDRNFLVAKFGEYQQATKLLSTYVKGWYKVISRTVDGTYDDHLRSDVVFFPVDTGRLASRSPNLQNIPARGKLSKIIKEMFIAPDGHLLIRFDYNAHEVRGWSIVSGDMALAETFRIGQQLRQQFIKLHPSRPLGERPKTDAEFGKLPKRVQATWKLIDRLKKEGDSHIRNVFVFFGKWVEKSDPLREAIKKVVFGTLYGKSAETLGHDTKEAELNVLKEKMGVAYKAGDKLALAKLEIQYKKLIEADRTAYATGIIDKMFASFKAGKRWIDKMKKLAEDEQYVYSPIGRIRHLYATMTKDKQIVNRQVRRGMNAPIQGFASEIAVKASRLVMRSYYLNLKRIKAIMDYDLKAKFGIRFNRIVHDASYFTVPYEMVLPFLHMLQYDMTYGITKAYKQQFGFDFTVEPEIEMEIGVKDTESHKWGWALPELLGILEKAVDKGIGDKLLSEPKSVIMGKILGPWRNDECLKLLNEKWPLLNVDLESEIKEALAAYDVDTGARAKAARVAAAALKKASTKTKETA